MEQITLLPATPEDAPEVLELTRAAFERYAKEIRKREKVAALREQLSDVERDIAQKNVFVMRLDSKLVGSVRFEVVADGIAYLSRFAVDPDVQNLGLGGLLLEKVRMECYAKGVRAITLHTASRMRSTVAFYLKNGYYIHSISKDSDYIRAFMVNELVEMDEMYDYEGVVGHPTPEGGTP